MRALAIFALAVAAPAAAQSLDELRQLSLEDLSQQPNLKVPITTGYARNANAGAIPTAAVTQRTFRISRTGVRIGTSAGWNRAELSIMICRWRNGKTSSSSVSP